MKKYQVILLSMAITAGIFVLFQDKVNALASPSGMVFGFGVECGTSPTKIVNGSNTPYNTLRCYNTSATPVYLSGDPATLSVVEGYEISTAATAVDSALSMDTAAPVYCMTNAGTVNINCMGGTK
ncbi:MAG: hypothetical protein Unbinned1446contig1004_45 [Prokaryotic dsDNA virus sp.]|nr:MAG: hypothetical protein Unbinned1446contig1004_45 [Prokaryotic dsDNA virus sp.]|tara:strand:+ start:8530 stop:8904 length:375 start_codon:yes stop_codon:yes gene_type:complete